VRRTDGEPDPKLGPVIARARRGDAEAFTALLRYHDRSLRGLVFRLIPDRDRAEDVLQDAYLKAFRALPRFRGESSLATWLYRIAYNACLDERRRTRAESRESPISFEDAPDPRTGGPDVAEAVVGQSAFVVALMSLPLEERAAVLLVDGGGLSYAAAAHALGVPVGTVASRLNRARPALRRVLESEGEAS
jgi:RNA polymerase sigma-70 factor, ECF subfamily